MFSNSAETRKVVEFGREESQTYEERWSANVVVKFIAYIVGVPSLGSVAFVSIVGLWYAWIFTSDWGTWAAVSAGLVFIAAFSAGLPIAWAHTRRPQQRCGPSGPGALDRMRDHEFLHHVAVRAVRPGSCRSCFYQGPRSLRR